MNKNLVLREIALNAKSWPFLEAKKILDKINYKTPEKGYVLFETGYGPSGLPHIGTFGEVARTTMVKFAFENLSDIPTKLVAFSDDLDALRKVPDNVPNKELLKENLGKSLTNVPDPFGKYNSFGEHNNAMLQDFLNKFGFDFNFYSSTKLYKDGVFNDALLKVLKHHKEILEIMLPTLGDERRANYSPFLPICKKTGKVLQAEVINYNIDTNTIVYIDDNNNEVETSVLNGMCKLQWKVDWAMRWYALEVDYEMYGKDLIASADLSTKICKILGKNPPQTLKYELFLDKNGEKISKSKGNGLSIEDWLMYGNKESLAFYMYQKPQTAKRLYFEVIPKSVDDWLLYLNKYSTLDDSDKIESPIFFVHGNNPPQNLEEITFTLILNLITVVNTDNKQMLWAFMEKYKTFNPTTHKIVNELFDYAINYYNNFVKPKLNYKVLDSLEIEYLTLLKDELIKLPENTDPKDIQNIVYQVGKSTELELKDWFRLLYQSLLGQDEGPRMGSFFALYGLANSIDLINKAINNNK
jgi:lysyl-tRNA synthetase, class I